MQKKIDIGQNAKVWIKWNTDKLVTTKDDEDDIANLFAQKYGIPVKNIRVEKNYVSEKSSNGALAGDVVDDIHDPRFQQELMKQYITDNNIADVDFEEILKIDSQINALVDYDTYNKSKEYEIKWVKWSNFLSYGPDNYFDFTKLKGLVLLNGEPANKSGKSTFAYDLLHFLLFGKTNTKKAKSLIELFNNYLPNEKTLTVEGCICIEGTDYIIRRTLTRPTNRKSKTVTNKVEYYKLSADGTEELLPDENQQGESSRETSRIIKESLGTESDFDLIISANANDLADIINMTETEKGRLLSRWIGLSVIEDKDVKAREKWNREISVGRYCDMYNQVQLEGEINDLTEYNKELNTTIKKAKSAITTCETNITNLNKKRDLLLSSKISVDDSLLKVDVTTLETTIAGIVEKGKRKKAELESANDEFGKIGDVDYSEEEYKNLQGRNEQLISRQSVLQTEIAQLSALNESLAKAEYCPTCHRKLDNVDNTKQIEENTSKIGAKKSEMESNKTKLSAITQQMAAIEQKRELHRKKSQLELKLATIKADIAQLRLDYTEKNELRKAIQTNKDAIAKNSEIDAKINVVNASIANEEGIRQNNNSTINACETEVGKNNEAIAQKRGFLVKIEEERKNEKYWKLYLQMIGKDGISKMVLRNTLPIINSELNRILNESTDFSVEISMNDKNDVEFTMIRDGVRTRLSASSGLETTQAALALRVVLGKLSKLSKPPFLLLDEVLGTVAKENYDDMKKLYDKIVAEYKFVLHICHIDLDWYDNNIITVTKKDNISHI